jgi:tRNA 5-methylaminomethyl-2-thiouridine biosynthesis bifunctional protein
MTSSPATIIWKDGVPVSDIYGDIYFSKESGLEETNHVFLNGNNLSQRWTEIKNDFHIIETGFGTGLNFFAAWDLWNKAANGSKLYFTSIEKHPLSISDIRQAISLWPQFDLQLNEFAEQYPAIQTGRSTLKLNNNNIHLTLLWGDVNNTLQTLNIKADAWFLDGFSPAANPDMWNDNLYKYMAELTNTGGSFATFTAVGNVRRGLQEHGFFVQKVVGYGQKRHILIGTKI